MILSFACPKSVSTSLSPLFVYEHAVHVLRTIRLQEPSQSILRIIVLLARIDIGNDLTGLPRINPTSAVEPGKGNNNHHAVAES